MSVGQRIKEARKERGLTQTELGEAIGIKQNTLSEMEAGKLKNWPLHAPKIARALGKPLAWFDPQMEEHTGNTPDLPPVDGQQAYVSIEVLPTFAGPAASLRTSFTLAPKTSYLWTSAATAC